MELLQLLGVYIAGILLAKATLNLKKLPNEQYAHCPVTDYGNSVLSATPSLLSPIVSARCG